MDNNKDNLLVDDAQRAESNNVNPTENDTVAEDFFSQLDRQVMGEVVEQPRCRSSSDRQLQIRTLLQSEILK